MLNPFRWSSIPPKQFIFIVCKVSSPCIDSTFTSDQVSSHNFLLRNQFTQIAVNAFGKINLRLSVPSLDTREV